MADVLPARAYQTYLLRAWCDEVGGQWRVMVQRAGSTERTGFPDLLSAFAFIEADLDASLVPPPPPRPPLPPPDTTGGADAADL